MENNFVIQVKNVSRSFAVPGGEFQALKGIYADISKGSLTILKGRSGSGKTTLMNIIGTLDALYADLAEGETSTERLVVLFDGKAGAFAYLLFVLLYMPCLSAMGAIAKEFSPGWAGFVMIWTTGQAYLLSTLFYQCAIIQRNVLYSGGWIAGIVLTELAVFTALYFAGKRRRYDSF